MRLVIDFLKTALVAFCLANVAWADDGAAATGKSMTLSGTARPSDVAAVAVPPC